MDKLKFFDSHPRGPDSIPRLHLSKKIRFLSTDQRVTTSCRLPPPSTHCSQTTCCRQTTRCRQPPRQDLPSILVNVDKKCYLTSKSSIFPSLPTFLFFSFSGSFRLFWLVPVAADGQGDRSPAYWLVCTDGGFIHFQSMPVCHHSPSYSPSLPRFIPHRNETFFVFST